MKALVLHAVGDVRLEERAVPRPGPGQALIRVAFCGVCGSDIPRVFVTGTYSFPTVPGHEFSGTVESLGGGVEGFQYGDQVTAFPLLWCGRCPACERGRYAQCSNYDYLGSRSDGAFAEYVAAPARNLVKLPPNVSLEEGAMTEPAAVALHALRRSGVSPGESVAVYGAGPIGLLVAQWARIMGAGQVIVVDLLPERLALAARLGFSLRLNPRDRDPVKEIHGLTRGLGAAVCVEAAGVAATLQAAIASAAISGRVVLLGNPSGDVTLPAALISQAMRRELCLLGAWNSEFRASQGLDDWRATLGAAANGSLQLKPLITHKLPLEEAIESLEMMRDQKEFFAKVLIKP
jgi:L-iditol 2-dehydrogenase